MHIRGLLFKFVDFPHCSFNTAFIKYQMQYYKEVKSPCFKNASFLKIFLRILHKNGLHSNLGSVNRDTPFFLIIAKSQSFEIQVHNWVIIDPKWRQITLQYGFAIPFKFLNAT